MAVSRHWVECAVVAIAIAVSNGPIIAWQTLEPIMLADGVFADMSRSEAIAKLDSLNSNTLAVGMAGLLLGGIMYDHLGPRVLAVSGAIGASAGLFGMSAAIQQPSLVNLLYPSYIFCIIMSYINAWGAAYYFIKIPSHPYMVAAVASCSFALGDAVGIFAAQLNMRFHVSSWQIFFGMAVLSLVGGAVCSAILPSLSQFKAERDGLGIPDTKEGGSGSGGKEGAGDEGCLWRALSKYWQDLRVACRLFCEKPELSLDTLHVLAMYMLVTSILVHQYQLYLALFGSSDASFLVNLSSLIFAFGGCVALLIWGAAAEGMGSRGFWFLLDIASTFFFASVATPLFAAQIVGEVMLTFLFNLITNALPFSIAFTHAPPYLFGVVSGLVYGLQGLFLITIMPIQEWAARLSFPDTGATSRTSLDANAAPRIFVVLYVWFVLTAMTGSLRYWNLWRSGSRREPNEGTGLLAKS